MINYIKMLRRQGVMGINQRNLDFILHANPPKYYPIADDKILTKELCREIDVNTPECFGIIETQSEIPRFKDIIKNHNDFVIKPAEGSGGKGILIIKECIHDKYRKMSDHILTQKQIDQHLSKIVSGVYSLGGYPDKVIIESRVIANPVFDDLCYRGVPDVRVIVYYGYPVMAMLRLPTIASDGKANLHQGAIGVGIDILQGKTTYGVLHNEIIDEHPDTLVAISGRAIPHWETILLIAAKCYELSNLGYIGVDLVLDENRGPMLLELNARPGLNIQIANHCGLLNRLALLKQHLDIKRDAAERVAYINTLFLT